MNEQLLQQTGSRQLFNINVNNIKTIEEFNNVFDKINPLYFDTQKFAHMMVSNQKYALLKMLMDHPYFEADKTFLAIQYAIELKDLLALKIMLTDKDVREYILNNDNFRHTSIINKLLRIEKINKLNGKK